MTGHKSAQVLVLAACFSETRRPVTTRMAGSRASVAQVLGAAG